MTALKIAFLCGSAEPGRDGVGDYTALLAAECARRGVETMRIALRDPWVRSPTSSAGLLRLPTEVGWEPATEALEHFNPDVVSLQWVPYAFHPKGVALGLRPRLRGLIGERKSHLMCHETWIGAFTGAAWRRRFVGRLQRDSLRSLARELYPVCVHTSNASYAGLLSRAGISAEVLPLFGAIPITGMREQPQGEALRFGLFGELHAIWPPEPLLTRLLELGRPIRIEHIGRIGSGEELWRKMSCRTDIAFQRHGEQPAERISQFLMDMDFGIATTPLALIGKSGTAAAMLEHGLPVIVNRDDVHFPGIDAGPVPEGVIVTDDRFPDSLREARPRPARSRLPEVADQFLGSIGRGGW